MENLIRVVNNISKLETAWVGFGDVLFAASAAAFSAAAVAIANAICDGVIGGSSKVSAVLFIASDNEE